MAALGTADVHASIIAAQYWMLPEVATLNSGVPITCCFISRPTRFAREGLCVKFEKTLDLCQFVPEMKAAAPGAIATPKNSNP
jgi:hypothetical protein